MKSPSLSSSTFAAVACLSLLSSSTRAAPAPAPPSPLRSSYSSPSPSSPSLSGPSSDPSPAATPDAPSTDVSGLGISIPLSKPKAYLQKRQEPVVDFAWLLQNKANVVHKFGGSINPFSPNFDPSLMTPEGTGGEEVEQVQEAIVEVVNVVSVSVPPPIVSTTTKTTLASPSLGQGLGNPVVVPNSSSTAAGPASTSSASTPLPVSPSPSPSTTTSASLAVSTSTTPTVSSPTGAASSPSASSSVQRRQSNGYEPLSDQGSLWMSTITMGGQDFQVDFDTGSSDLWIPHVQCSKDGCVGHKKYTVTRSAKAKSGSFAIAYGDGSKTSGPIYSENGAIAGLSFTNQTFSPVTQMSSSFANDGGSGYPADGIAGMGFPSLSQMRAPPFFQNLVSQKQVSSSVFSFRLAHSDAELYLGGINPSHYTGAITYTSVTQQAYWTIAMDAVAVGSTVVKVQGKKAIIDTGTTLVYGSYDDVNTIFASIPGSKDMAASYGADYQGYHTFPCSTSPSVSLAFGGKYFTVGAKAFNLGKAAAGSKDCVAAIVGQDPKASGLGNTFLVGDAFLVGVYAIFDVGNSRVGFAAPK